MIRSRWTVVALLASITLFLSNCSTNKLPTPTPIITAISPDSVIAGSADFTLFISGSGLSKISVGFLDGTMRATTFNAQTSQLEMSIAAADVAVPDSSVQITVVNPAPGGASHAVTFVVEPVANGAPTISTFTPSMAAAGTAGPFAVSVAGTGFIQTSVVSWFGSPRPTTFVSSSQLMVNLTTQDLATPVLGPVSVSNPAPGGGVSPSKSFPVN